MQLRVSHVDCIHVADSVVFPLMKLAFVCILSTSHAIYLQIKLGKLQVCILEN